MTSIESTKGYEATYNDAECQEMYEDSMRVSTAEQKRLQKEVKIGPKTNEDAKNLIKKGEIWAVVNYMDNYRGLDSSVAETLIKKGHKDLVLSNLDKFICDKDLAIVLIKNKEGEFVSRRLSDFPGITVKEAIKLCIQLKYDNESLYKICYNYITNNRQYKIIALDSEIARFLINLKISGDGPLHREQKTIEYRNGCDLVRKNLFRFKGLDNGIAKILIRKGFIQDVIEYVLFFPNIDQVKLIDTARDLGLDFGFILKYRYRFNQKGRDYILKLRKQLNYRLVKDKDGKMKTFEELATRVETFLSKVYYPTPPGSPNFVVDSIKSDTGSDYYNNKRFDVKVRSKNGRDSFLLKLYVDPVSGKDTFKIPGLNLKFGSNEEVIRTASLISWLRNNREILVYPFFPLVKTEPHKDIDNFCRFNGDLCRRSKSVMVKNSDVKKYYPSIKDSKKFIDYINKM